MEKWPVDSCYGTDPATHELCSMHVCKCLASETKAATVT